MDSNLDKNIFDKYTNTNMACKCGRNHIVYTKKIIIKNGANSEIANTIDNLMQIKNILVVCDVNTYPICGESIIYDLKASGYKVNLCIFTEKNLHADEKAIGKMLIETDDNIELIVAVGSGTINDITRFVAYKIKKPYIIVATAPSMDGYASTVSPLIINGFKRTVVAVHPIAIIADTNILKDAPSDMIVAGFGDVLGKITALSDWMLANTLNGEYYCEYVAEMMTQALRKCIDNVEGLKSKSEAAINGIMEGLILSGIAMQMVGNSRPASGAEHHMAHFVEMQHMMKGKVSPLHGIKVGITVNAIIRIYKEFFKDENYELIKNINLNSIAKDKNLWENQIKRCYGTISNEVINENNDYSIEDAYDRQKKLIASWSNLKKSIYDILNIAPDTSMLMKTANGPINFSDIDVDREMLYDALIYSKEVRNRYTILRLVDDFGLLKAYADIIIEEL